MWNELCLVQNDTNRGAYATSIIGRVKCRVSPVLNGELAIHG